MYKDVRLGEEEVRLVVRAEVIVEMGVVDRGGDDLDEIVRLLTWRSVGVREG
jgi:hypothetical protein